MIVSLPMYDRAETAEANDALWRLVRDALGCEPRALDRETDAFEAWHSPDLLLSQTCSLPYRAVLKDRVTLVAAPVHDLPAPPGCYYSVAVAQRGDDRRHLDDFAGATLAYNDPLSQSGWAVAEASGIPFGRYVRTGAHRKSARAVHDGTADIAFIDGVTWAMIRRWDAWSEGLRVVIETEPTPALPYITASNRDPDALFTALEGGIAALPDNHRDTLRIRGVVRVDPVAYRILPIPPEPPTDRA